MKKMTTFFGIILGVLFCLVSTAPPAAAAPKALLIGVGTYKHLPYTTPKGEKLNNLRGPVNDVQKIKEVLVSGYNFSPDNIRVLKDHEATREAILKNFNQWLVRI
ncbi:MAG: caspase family protein [Deltaproteobacteria bacterium]|nr:caspase family protein [Deltaproteobacteria bacterium]